MAGFCPKRWIAEIRMRLQGTAVSSPLNKGFRKTPKPKRSKPPKISRQERGGSRSKARASAQLFILTKATANFRKDKVMQCAVRVLIHVTDLRITPVILRSY